MESVGRRRARQLERHRARERLRDAVHLLAGGAGSITNASVARPVTGGRGFSSTAVTATSCYRDAEATGLGMGDAGVDLDTSQMQSRVSFARWDFASVCQNGCAGAFSCEPVACPEIAIALPPADFCGPDKPIVRIENENGCLTGFGCGEACPAIAAPPADFCDGGLQPTLVQKPDGCPDWQCR